jgi:hypothetical protein
LGERRKTETKFTSGEKLGTKNNINAGMCLTWAVTVFEVL